MQSFEAERIPISNFRVYDIEPDGACLFRSLSNGLFFNCNQNIIILKQRFKDTGYFSNEYKDFLKDYVDIAECFEDQDSKLDDDVEADIARGLQQVILNFVKKNPDYEVSEKMPISQLIFLCFDIDVETYLKNYQIFAGDDDFIVKSSVDKKGKKVEVREIIEDRWGGIPEIMVFSILFQMDVTVYIAQKMNKKGKIENAIILKNSFLKKIEEIKTPFTSLGHIELILQRLPKGDHYVILS